MPFVQLGLATTVVQAAPPVSIDDAPELDRAPISPSGSKTCLLRDSEGAWDGEARPLADLADPVDVQDAATKAYVDAAVGSASGAFDPNADMTVTGQWNFHQKPGATYAIKVTDPNNTVPYKFLVLYSDGNDLVQLDCKGSTRFRLADGAITLQVWDSHNSGVIVTPPNEFRFGTFDSTDTALARLVAGIVRVTQGSAFDGLGEHGGALCLGDTAARAPRPAASAALRGTIWITWGDPGAADVISVCMKNAADAYAWVDVKAAP